MSFFNNRPPKFFFIQENTVNSHNDIVQSYIWKSFPRLFDCRWIEDDYLVWNGYENIGNTKYKRKLLNMSFSINLIFFSPQNDDQNRVNCSNFLAKKNKDSWTSALSLQMCACMERLHLAHVKKMPFMAKFIITFAPWENFEYRKALNFFILSIRLGMSLRELRQIFCVA